MKKVLFSAALFVATTMSFAQVGVGTTTPAIGTKLHVDGASDNTDAVPDATKAANDFVVMPDGSVGIGVTAPTVKLEVAGAIKIGTQAIATPVAGMIVFGDPDGTGTIGFYGFDGTTWVPFAN